MPPAYTSAAFVEPLPPTAGLWVRDACSPRDGTRLGSEASPQRVERSDGRAPKATMPTPPTPTSSLGYVTPQYLSFSEPLPLRSGAVLPGAVAL